MNPNERHEQILDLLRSRPTVQIVELSEALGVSRETVRKDLTDLDDQGRLIKVWGGAIAKGTSVESAYDERKRANTEAKRQIARRAVECVEDGMTVFLDYGTTTYMVAAELMNHTELTVVTNALPIASLLSNSPGLTIVIPGGVLRSNENSLYGPPTLRNLDYLNMDLGFFGCAGVAPQTGVTNHHMFETSVSAYALRHCRRGVLLADASKIGVVAANRTAGLDAFDMLITDSLEVVQWRDQLGDDTTLTILQEDAR